MTQRDDRDIDDARANRSARDVERRGHRSPRALRCGGTERDRLGRRATAGRSSQRGASRIERDVAASDDNNTLPQVHVKSLVDVEEVLDGPQDAIEVVAGELEIACAARADREEQGRVLIQQCVESLPLPHAEPGADLDAELEDRVDLACDETAARRYSGIPSTIIPPRRSSAS